MWTRYFELMDNIEYKKEHASKTKNVYLLKICELCGEELEKEFAADFLECNDRVSIDKTHKSTTPISPPTEEERKRDEASTRNKMCK